MPTLCRNPEALHSPRRMVSIHFLQCVNWSRLIVLGRLCQLMVRGFRIPNLRSFATTACVFQIYPPSLGGFFFSSNSASYVRENVNYHKFSVMCARAAEVHGSCASRTRDSVVPFQPLRGVIFAYDRVYVPSPPPPPSALNPERAEGGKGGSSLFGRGNTN